MKSLTIISILILCIGIAVCTNTPPILASEYSVHLPQYKKNYHTTDGFNYLVEASKITLSLIEKESEVLVFDPSGRNIFRQVCKKQTIDIPIQQKGIHIVRIKKPSNKIFTQKIVVK